MEGVRIKKQLLTQTCSRSPNSITATPSRFQKHDKHLQNVTLLNFYESVKSYNKWWHFEVVSRKTPNTSD